MQVHETTMSNALFLDSCKQTQTHSVFKNQLVWNKLQLLLSSLTEVRDSCVNDHDVSGSNDIHRLFLVYVLQTVKYSLCSLKRTRKQVHWLLSDCSLAFKPVLPTSLHQFLLVITMHNHIITMHNHWRWTPSSPENSNTSRRAQTDTDEGPVTLTTRPCHDGCPDTMKGPLRSLHLKETDAPCSCWIYIMYYMFSIAVK